MGLFNRKKQEIRADPVSFEDALLQSLLGNTAMTKKLARQIPTVSGAIDLIGNIIAGTPVKLYEEKDGKATPVKGDPRISLLNDDTRDTLNAHDFWKAIVDDYFYGKGGYAYIKKSGGEYESVHYVDEAVVSINMNTDPIFKDYDILVNGATYKPYDFLKVLRNSKNGAYGTGIITEIQKALEVAYDSLVFESNLIKKGGNKKGFLKSAKTITDDAMAKLKSAYSNLYSNNTSENVVVLNNGIDFIESSNTSVEMQLNENKTTNSYELSKIFHVSPDVIAGKATESDIASLAKLAAIPLMVAIQCALNRDFLLEKEKESRYWAFDTKELLKGGMLERYTAYGMALDKGFMQVDEVRFDEDKEPLGIDFIKLGGLDNVFYNPKTKEIYTPNTDKKTNIDLKGGGTI